MKKKAVQKRSFERKTFVSSVYKDGAAIPAVFIDVESSETKKKLKEFRQLAQELSL